MPRQPNDKENLSDSTSYGPFFSTSSSILDRHIAELEKSAARKETITKVEHCQELIKNREAKKDRVEQLLKQDNFSSDAKKEQAENLLKSLTAELKDRHAELASLIEPRPSLQAHFSNPRLSA